MRAVAYGAVIAATALVAAGCGSQHSAVSSDAGPGETRCNPLAGLEADHSGATLARVAQEHTPADGEIEAAALVWAIAIAGANGSPLDPAVADANPRGVTAFVQSAYPTAFAYCSSAPVGSSVQKLVTSSDDFSCGNSCAPSPVLFEKALDTIVERLVPDRAMPAVGDRTQGWGLARLSNAGNSQMIAQAMSIAEGPSLKACRIRRKGWGIRQRLSIFFSRLGKRSRRWEESAGISRRLPRLPSA